MPSPKYQPCEACGAQIWFALVSNQAGKPPGPMPLDKGESATGNVAVLQDEQQVWRGRVLSHANAALAAGEHRAMPHFATCTRPAEFRKRVAAARAAQHKAQRLGRGRRPSGEQIALELPGMKRVSR